jgi:hypothetical protein
MPQVPAQRRANPEQFPAARGDQPPTADFGRGDQQPTANFGRGEQPADPEYGREHFTGPLRGNRAAQHRAGDDPTTDSDRTVAIPRPAADSHPANAETMVLPVFVTGRKEPEPAPAKAEPARPPSGADGSLPASERGMLVFVAALLGAGTIAVVTMLGLGGLNAKHPAPVPVSTPTTAPAGGAPTPAASPSGTSPTPASPSTAASPTLAKTTAKHLPSPTPALLGQPQPLTYCLARTHGLPKAPDHDHPTWTCTTGRRGQVVPFTPEQVCDWQYGNAAHAVVGSLADYSTWKCYK